MYHYTYVGMEQSHFSDSLESLTSIIEEYRGLEKETLSNVEPISRLQIVT